MGTFRTLADTDLRSILSRFGKSGLRGHQTIAAGTINTNVAVELEDRRLFLRVNEGKAREDVQREAAIVAHVAARGVSTPAPLKADTGESFLAFGDSFVSLFPWVEGKTLGRRDIGPAHAQQVGAALAQLHVAGVDMTDRRPGRYEPDEIDRRFALIAKNPDPALAEAIRILGAALPALAQERRIDLPLGLIHADLFIDNVLFAESGQLVALLDFEQASWGRLAYDVAVSVLAFGYGNDDFRPDVTRAFIDGYAGVRAFSEAERAGFGAELQFAACRFAVTRITDVHLRRLPGAPAGKEFQRYLARLASVRAHLQADDGLLTLP